MLGSIIILYAIPVLFVIGVLSLVIRLVLQFKLYKSAKRFFDGENKNDM